MYKNNWTKICGGGARGIINRERPALDTGRREVTTKIW